MLVPIGAADIKEYHGDEIPVKARLYANKSFKTSEGVFIQAGSIENPDFYQEFDLTYNGEKVRIEAGDAYSTSDSDQRDATYDLDAYDADGGFLFHIFSRLSIVPVSIPHKPDDDFNDGVLGAQWETFLDEANTLPNFKVSEPGGKLHLECIDGAAGVSGGIRTIDTYNFIGHTIEIEISVFLNASGAIQLNDPDDIRGAVLFNNLNGYINIAAGSSTYFADTQETVPSTKFKIEHDSWANTWLFFGYRAGVWELIFTSDPLDWQPISMQLIVSSTFLGRLGDNVFDNLITDIDDATLQPSTWDQITEDSKAVKMKYPPTYMSTEIIERRLAQLTNTAFRSSSTMIGTTKLDVDPDDLSEPIAVGVNSPLLLAGGALAGVGTYGRVRTDVAPINPADPVAVGTNSPLIVRHLNGYANLAAAIAAGPGIIPITQPMTISANTTTPAANTLNIMGAGQINVAAGVTLTIGSLLNPGTRKIFTLTDAASHVIIAPGAIDRLNIAWFAGNAGGDATRAINECFLSCAIDYGNGNKVYIPNTTNPWTTTGGHIVPYGTHLYGLSLNSDALAGSRLYMAASNTFMFKISDQIWNTKIEYIAFNNNSQTNATAILFEGTTLASIGHHFYKNVFAGFSQGIAAIPTSGFGWMVNQVIIDQNYFIGCNNGIYWYSINGVVKITHNTFQLGAAQWGMVIQHAGSLDVEWNEIGGSVGLGHGNGFAWIRADFAGITFEGNESEGIDFFILDESLTSGHSVVNLKGNLLAGVIMLNSLGTTNYFSEGNNYFDAFPFQDKNTPNPTTDARVHSRDTTNFKHQSLANFSNGAIMVSEWRQSESGSGATAENFTHIQQYKNRIIENPYLAFFLGDTDPMHQVYSYRNRDLIAWGASGYATTEPIADYRAKYLTGGRFEWRFTHTTAVEQTFGGWVLKNFPLVTPPVRPPTMGGPQYNWNPGQCSNLIYAQSAVAAPITGVTFDNPQIEGMWFYLVNVGTFNIDLPNEDTTAGGSVAANRLLTTSGATITLTPNQQAFFHYDGTAQRWRVSKMN